MTLRLHGASDRRKGIHRGREAQSLTIRQILTLIRTSDQIRQQAFAPRFQGSRIQGARNRKVGHRRHYDAVQGACVRYRGRGIDASRRLPSIGDQACVHLIRATHSPRPAPLPGISVRICHLGNVWTLVRTAECPTAVR